MQIAVLRGGPSAEYDVSLETGDALLKSLGGRHEMRDILIDKEEVWHFRGMPVTPERALRGIDAALLGLHGAYGEDGRVQRILDVFAVPYAGSAAIPCALSMHKSRAKNVFREAGLKTPYSIVISEEDAEREGMEKLATRLFSTFPQPLLVKPLCGGSSLGITVAHATAEIMEALEAAFAWDEKVLVEEYIPGKEATVGIIEGFRGEELYALMPVEIAHGEKTYSYEAKRSAETKHVAPSYFSHEDKKALEAAARAAHQALGLSHYSRADFIVSPRRGIYLLEVNALPGLTSTCPFPKALEASGIALPQFAEHLVSLAVKK